MRQNCRAVCSWKRESNCSLEWLLLYDFLSLSLSHFSHIQLFVTLWTVAHQASLSIGILQARILEWVAVPSSRGSSGAREHRSLIPTCIGRQVLYH